jgi:hypothetical protein
MKWMGGSAKRQFATEPREDREEELGRDAQSGVVCEPDRA